MEDTGSTKNNTEFGTIYPPLLGNVNVTDRYIYIILGGTI